MGDPQIFLPQAVAKVEIFAECVDRHDDGWNAVMHCCANAVRVAERITLKVTHALMRDATELLQQSAVKSKVRRNIFGIVNVKCRCGTAAKIDSASIAPNILAM